MAEQCNTCRFKYRIKVPANGDRPSYVYFQCRRFPPPTDPTSWPTVLIKNWCGEYQALPTAEPEGTEDANKEGFIT